MIFAWGKFAANVCRGPEVAITVSGSVIDFGGSASPETRCLCCLYDFGCNFAATTTVGILDSLFAWLFKGKKSDDISPGHLLAKRTQLQVDVKDGVSLASPFH
jgi:hypothetical protein